LSFRNKLLWLVVGSALVPLVVATNVLLVLNRARAIAVLEDSLQSNGQSLSVDWVAWTSTESSIRARTLAGLVESAQIDLSNPAAVDASRNQLQNYLKLNNSAIEYSIDETSENPTNFQFFVDARGRMVAASAEIFDLYASQATRLPSENEPTQLIYRTAQVEEGVELGDIRLVREALAEGTPLSGMEILDRLHMERLGIVDQARRPDGSVEPLGMTGFAVHPVKSGNRVVGAAISGTLLNNHPQIVDQFSDLYGIAVTGIFAGNTQVATNAPNADGQTRMLGTQADPDIAAVVLERGQELSSRLRIQGKRYLAYYTPLYDYRGTLYPGSASPIGMTVVAQPLAGLDAELALQLAIAISAGAIVLAVASLVALPVASSLAESLKRLEYFARQVSEGQGGIRLQDADRRDEIGGLAKELNQMAVSIETSDAQLRFDAKQAGLLAAVARVEILNQRDLNRAFGKALQGARQLLEVDRVIVYEFNSDWSGSIAHESVVQGWPSALEDARFDPCIPPEILAAYREGRVVATADVRRAGFHPNHLNLMEQLQVRANLVVPVLNQGNLFGLLIAHHCAQTHDWHTGEINFLKQLAILLGASLDRWSYLELQRDAEDAQRSAKEFLQRRALELLEEVDPIRQGDLTVRAKVTADEIGTIADSYNSIAASLRRLVEQVQTVAAQVVTTATGNDDSIQTLAGRTLQQTAEISSALERLQAMARSMQTVAADAEQAELTVRQASQVVDEGGAAMNRTVEGIVAIRETVAETAEKVQKLGATSQRISQAVNLIGRFAAQTHMLALKASIEAARSGESGQGFAVIANEVRALAEQSAHATEEIASLVAAVQSQTQEVAEAMAAGTERVATGTQLVDDTRRRLTQIAAASDQIESLVVAIAQTAIEQSQTSEIVTQTMVDVASIASQSSADATEVSRSFTELLAAAQALQDSVGQFKTARTSETVRN
jgi:methyl-accepting chemotaxis protein PixJ